jgi:hypothetical protein
MNQSPSEEDDYQKTPGVQETREFFTMLLDPILNPVHIPLSSFQHPSHLRLGLPLRLSAKTVYVFLSDI